MQLENLPLHEIIEHIHEAVLIVTGGAQARVVFANPASAALLGCTLAELLSQQYDLLQAPSLGAETRDALRAALSGEAAAQAVIQERAGQASETWLEVQAQPVKEREGAEVYWAVILRDITELKLQESQIALVAQDDPLTGLLNRRTFLERVEHEWQRARRHARLYSLVAVDIDFFKLINDTYGRQVGDMVLRLVSNHLHSLVRSQDIAGRTGGEEFAILMPETDLEGAYLAAERLREAVADYVMSTDNWSISVTLSLGVAQVYASDATAGVIVQRAEMAMKQAKKDGRNRTVKAT
ncbi:MAG: sensor domain-containing diguanylate cyclase [Chloroflexota bacterium]